MELTTSDHDCIQLGAVDAVYTCGECRAVSKTICGLFNHLLTHRTNKSTSKYWFDDLIKVGYLRHETSDSAIQTCLDENEGIASKSSKTELDISKLKEKQKLTENAVVERLSSGSLKGYPLNRPDSSFVTNEDKSVGKRRRTADKGLKKVSKEIVADEEKSAGKKRRVADKGLKRVSKEIVADEEKGAEKKRRTAEKRLKKVPKEIVADEEKDAEKKRRTAEKRLKIVSKRTVRMEKAAHTIEHNSEIENYDNASTCSSMNKFSIELDRSVQVNNGAKLKVHKTWIPESNSNINEERIIQTGYSYSEHERLNHSAFHVLNMSNQSKNEEDEAEPFAKSQTSLSSEIKPVKKLSKDGAICYVCGKVCHTRKSLHSHMTEQHQSAEGMKTCPECGKQFPTNSKLRQHFIVHSAITTYSCEVCEKTFPRKNALNAHMKFIHSENIDGMLSCPKCDKTFLYPSSYAQHLQAHQAAFKCERCEMVFSRRSSLKRHEMRHTGVKAHSCGICGHGFIQKSAYWIHMEKHHDLTRAKLLEQTSIEDSDV